MTTEVFRRLDEVLEGIPRTGVVHVGAHRGQEVKAYRSAGFKRIVLVEPNPRLLPVLSRFGANVVVHGCAAGAAGVATLNVTDWDERSSLLDPTDYRVVETFDVDVQPLADLQVGCNVAVLDCQGSELDVLATAALDELDCIIVEVCDRPRYEGGATAAEVTQFMTAAGWRHTGDYGGHSSGIVDQAWRHPTCV